MKLVVDNTNIETLPIENLADIGEASRILGNEIDAGQHGNVLTLVSLVVRDDGMAILVRGESASNYELMGIFEAAKLRVFADDVIED